MLTMFQVSFEIGRPQISKSEEFIVGMVRSDVEYRFIEQRKWRSKTKLELKPR
jgi:hypothetical protein